MRISDWSSDVCSSDLRMEILWTPWRMEYLENPIREEGCLFCSRLQMNEDEENLILHRGELAFVMLNRYPYTNGHLMVVPNAHQIGRASCRVRVCQYV